MTATSHAATLRDGTRIGYTIHAPADAAARADLPRVVLIHSLALDRGIWEGVCERLAGRTLLLALDCRGHGASDKPPGPYTAEGFADDLAQVLDHAGWPRALIAGCSMGGTVALAFACAFPGRTAALVPIDTTAWYGPDGPANWRARAAKAEAEGMAALEGFQAERWFNPAFGAANPDVLARWLGVFRRNDVRAYAAACAMLGAADLRARLPAIAAPTFVAVGEEDHATPPAMAEAIVAAVPGASLTVLQGARHITPVERPGQIAALLARAIAAAQ